MFNTAIRTSLNEPITRFRLLYFELRQLNLQSFSLARLGLIRQDCEFYYRFLLFNTTCLCLLFFKVFVANLRPTKNTLYTLYIMQAGSYPYAGLLQFRTTVKFLSPGLKVIVYL